REVVDRLPAREPGAEQALIPLACHDRPAVAGELVGQVLAIADADDLAGRIVAQIPGGEGDRAAEGFQEARRGGDDEPLDPPQTAGLELVGDRLDMEAAGEGRLRVELVEAALDEAHHVVPEDVFILARSDDHSGSSGSDAGSSKEGSGGSATLGSCS